jgi:hypothetical protein
MTILKYIPFFVPKPIFFGSLLLFCWNLLAEEMTLDAVLRDADFIFEGIVQRIEYRHSDPVGSEPGLPYTFVSYRVEKVIKGAYSAPELTLRFLGGPVDNSGQVLLPPQYPRFDPGDHDILFVTGNTYFDCPLVGCRHGRLRFIDGQIVDGNDEATIIDDLEEGESLSDILSARVRTLGFTAADNQKSSVVSAEINRPFLSRTNRAETEAFIEEHDANTRQKTSGENLKPKSKNAEKSRVEKLKWMKGTALFIAILLALVAIIQISRKKFS